MFVNIHPASLLFFPSSQKPPNGGFICAWEQARPDGHKFATLISAAGHSSLVFLLGKKKRHHSAVRPCPKSTLVLFFPSSQKPPNGGFICAWEQARTADPSLFRRMLYQLSYPSKTILVMAIVPIFQLISNANHYHTGSQ